MKIEIARASPATRRHLTALPGFLHVAMTLGRVAIGLAFAGTVALPSIAAPIPDHAHFVDGSKNPAMSRVILHNLDSKRRFNRTWVQSFVSCGLGCGSYWFVNVKDGAVLAAPDKSTPPVSIQDLRFRADSDRIEVVYGPDDGSQDACESETYRMTGRTFTLFTPRRKTSCPQ